MKPHYSTLLAVLALLLIYLSSYFALSVGGRYEPGAIGLNGVKWYDWAPRGFVDGYRWRAFPMVVYAPLWGLDRRWWHTPEKARSGEYPVDEVKQEEIGKVYKAYGF